jgi:acetyl-CoA C-acetyltransferase
MSWNPDDAVIVAVGRSPIGRARKGALKDIRPDDLAAQVVGAVMDRVAGLAEGTVEDLVLGCAQPEGEHGGNIARRVAVMLGRDDLPGTTVNRFCASSLQAARMAFHGIRAGEGDAYVIGGVESVSRYGQIDSAENPVFDDARAHAQRQAHETGSWQDPRLDGSLPDVYIPMGLTAEFVARHTGTTRQDQDAYAARSQQRAARAQDEGFMAREIIPVRLPDGSVVDADDSLRRGTTTEKLAELSPAFLEDGTVTAGNACPLNDGASAAVILSGRRATDLGVTPLARIVSSAVTGLSPEIMGLGPVEASRVALRRAGLEVGDLDAVELNEAFAAQVLPTARQLGLDEDRLNPHGGAIALGHPFGSTGARMLGTLINDLQTLDGQLGLATLCVGGGQGMAMVVERL